MTDTEKTELFAALAALTDLYPHWRVGQLISNVAGWADATNRANHEHFWCPNGGLPLTG